VTDVVVGKCGESCELDQGGDRATGLPMSPWSTLTNSTERWPQRAGHENVIQYSNAETSTLHTLILAMTKTSTKADRQMVQQKSDKSSTEPTDQIMTA